MKVLRSLMAALVLLSVALLPSRLALGQAAATLHAVAADATGAPVPGARVMLTNTQTGSVLNSLTGPDGAFDLTGLAPGTYSLTITLQGFVDYKQSGISLQSGQTLSFNATLHTKSVVQSVTVTAEGSPETAVTQATISRAEISGVAGPFGSAAQALTAAPGVFVYGYGGVAATARSEVVLRGVKGGWSSVNGDVLRNGIAFLYDGIPMNNMIANNGQWQTTQIPITDMISDITVDYGPGAPSNRWFDSLGGTVNYIPYQPKTTPGGTITFGTDYGSYNTSITHLIANTGMYRGWSGLLAFGYAMNDTFRVGTIGIPTFSAPSSGYAVHTKVLKQFSNGTLSIAYYHGRNTEYRPNFIPLLPITPASNNNYGDAVTTTGLYGPDSQPGTAVPSSVQYYSQSTSGFYSSLAQNVWNKQIRTQSDILYGKLALAISPGITFNSSSWYRHGYRLHNRVVNFYGPNYSVSHEWYDPASNTIGNDSSMAITAPHNTVTIGGYWMHGDYHNPVALFNPALGTSTTSPAFFNADRLYNDYGFLFLQDRVSFFKDRLIVTPGAAEQLFRTDYYNTGLTDFPAGNPANDTELAPSTHKNFLKFAPSVGAQGLVTNWLTLHGNFAITYQNPTDSAFGANRAINGVNIAQLKAVKSENVEGGFLVTKCPLAIMGSCSLDATYFHDKLSHVNVVTQTAQLSLPAAVALASSVNNGVSVNFDNAPMRYLRIHGNAIIQHNYFLSYIPSGSTQNFASYPISNNPKYSTNVGVTTEYKSGDHRFDLTPGLWWQYVGVRYLFSNVNNAPTTLTSPGYGVVNFNTDGTINGLLPGRLEEVPVKLSFGIENLLNREYNPTAYITSGGYFGTSFGGYTLVDPGAPREYIVSLNFGFK
jgi:iron complex outermembrane receptor protein